jgi:zinc transport system substrate-binding protein
MKSKKSVLIVLIVIMVIMMGVIIYSLNFNNSKKNNSEKKVVAVTIVPEQAFVEAVCGDLADVVVMVPPGSSPENYEPTSQQMTALSDAELYFSIGVPTEKANILPKVNDLASNINVISLNDEVSKVYDDRTFDSGERDPHIWLSPKRVIVMINTIAEKMSKIDPENKEVYESNAKQYIAKLEKLDLNMKAALENVTNPKFIVYHPAFGYLANDYGLTMYALEEEGKEATAESLKEKINIAKSENIKTIFYQAEIDSEQAKSFADEIGGKTTKLEPLSKNYIENLQNMINLIAEVME